MSKLKTFLKIKMKSKIFISVVLSALMCLLCISFGGCSNGKEKPEISVYLYKTGLLKHYAPYLQSQVPEAKLVFTVGRENEGFYSFKNQNDDLPDIITVGTVSPNDEHGLRGALMDLGQTDVAASIPETYLSPYRDATNALKWLPVGGELNGIVANGKLFEEKNIPIPTDYASFQSACEQFKELGIRPFFSDYKYDYTCLHTLEGCAVSTLISSSGMTWRKSYEHGSTNSLDETLWKEVFDKFADFASDAGVDSDLTTKGYNDTRNAFLQEKAAMIRGANREISAYAAADPVFLPYFGATQDDNRFLTTPNFHVALNANLNESKNKELALKVLDAMFSAEGYAAMSTDGDTEYFVSYSNHYKSAIPESLANIEPYVNKNSLFPLLSSDNFLNAAKIAVQAYLKGDNTANEAYATMNDALVNATSAVPEKYTVDAAYSSAFTSGGNKAASAIANTLRAIAGTELLLAPSSICTGSIYKTQYTYDLLDECVQSSGNHLHVYGAMEDVWIDGVNEEGEKDKVQIQRLKAQELSGKDIRALVKAAVEGYDSLNDPFSEETLPVASGMVLYVKKENGKFILDDVTVNGWSLDDTETYTIAIADMDSNANSLVAHALGETAKDRFKLFGAKNDYAHSLWADRIKDGGTIKKPTDYIFIN